MNRQQQAAIMPRPGMEHMLRPEQLYALQQAANGAVAGWHPMDPMHRQTNPGQGEDMMRGMSTPRGRPFMQGGTLPPGLQGRPFPGQGGPFSGPSWLPGRPGQPQVPPRPDISLGGAQPLPLKYAPPMLKNQGDWQPSGPPEVVGPQAPTGLPGHPNFTADQWHNPATGMWQNRAPGAIGTSPGGPVMTPPGVFTGGVPLHQPMPPAGNSWTGYPQPPRPPGMQPTLLPGTPPPVRPGQAFG